VVTNFDRELTQMIERRWGDAAAGFGLVWVVGVTAYLVATAGSAHLRLWLFLLPVLGALLAVMPLRGGWKSLCRVTGFAAVALFVVLTVLSIGILYFPAALALFIALGQ
jgi:hypothetical protein